MSQLVRRWYQKEAVEAVIHALFTNPDCNPLIQLPTGSGKSIINTDIIMEILKYYPATQFICLTHVQELVENNAKTFLSEYPNSPVGIYCAGLKKRDTLHPIIFGSIASVSKNPKQFGVRHVIIIDEAHLISPDDATMYQKAINALKEIYPNIRVVGMTATGWRTKQGRLTSPGGMFTEVVYDITTPQAFQRLIAEGYLVPAVSRATTTKIDVSNVGRTNGDFRANELQQAANKEEITRAALTEAMEAGWDRRCGMIFASGTLHVEAIYEMLYSMGVSSVFIHSHIQRNDRKKRLDLFTAGKVNMIVGNKILTTGFNHPPIDMIIDLQPTESVGNHVQKIGRGLRPSPATHKENCLVFDFGGNIARNGPVDCPYVPIPGGGKRTGDIPLKVCPSCNTYNYTIARFCSFCNFEFIFEIKLTSTASVDNPMQGVDPVVETFPVDHVSYINHPKEGLPPSLKVVYTCGKRQFMEFISIESSQAYARKCAQQWWMQRHSSTPPLTTQAIISMSSQLRVPKNIRVQTNLKYPKVQSCEY